MITISACVSKANGVLLDAIMDRLEKLTGVKFNKTQAITYALRMTERNLKKQADETCLADAPERESP